MAVPKTFNLTGTHAVYSGSDWSLSFGAVEEGGRGINDLVLVSASTAATSASAVFTVADTGKKISTVDGTGITDGTTMTFVSATQVTLSAAATATGTYVASVRALNAASYTTHSAQVKRAEGDVTPVCTFTISVARAVAGWFVFTLPEATTEPLSGGGVWDWRVSNGTVTAYWLAGKVRFVKNVTET